jgi:hypothetical protein
MAPKMASKAETTDKNKKISDSDSNSDSDSGDDTVTTKKTRKQEGNEMFAKLMEEKNDIEEEEAEVAKKKKEFNKRLASFLAKHFKVSVPRPENPVPIPKDVADFLNSVIKGKKIPNDILAEFKIDTKKPITTDMKMDRKYVQKIMWNYITSHCKKDKDEDSKMPNYQPDDLISALVGKEKFNMGSLNKRFAALYTTAKKTNSKDSSSDSESHSGSESESESEEKVKSTKTKTKAKTNAKSNAKH